MNVTRIALAAAVLIVVGVVVTRTLDRTESTAVAEVLGVDQVAKNPAAFADQEVRLTGVVSAVVPDEQLFAVIDQAEYASCKVVSCSQYQIPISYAGDLPAVEASTSPLRLPVPKRRPIRLLAWHARAAK